MEVCGWTAGLEFIVFLFWVFPMFRKLICLGLLACCCLMVSDAEADWLRFRGPNGSGISDDSAATPVKWDSKKNVKWKVKLPGAGVSSPIVVGDRVFVTCYSGYGMDRQNPGNIDDLTRHLVCVDRVRGKILWNKSVKAAQPEDPYSGIGVVAHGYASHTPVSDGENVYVFFGKSGAIAFDMEGNQLWQKSAGSGSDDKRWGSSSSPILHDDIVIITAAAESRALLGLKKKTGEEVWRQETDGLTDVWGTPLLVKVGDRTDLVIGVPYEFWGLNPDTGKLRWYSDAMDTDTYNSSVVEANGVIYGIEGRGGGSAAIKAGGKGDVTKANTVWTGNDSARFGSPLVLDGRIYYFANGVATCISADDGSSIFKGRLPGAASSERPTGDRPSSDRPSGDRPSRSGRGGRFGGGHGAMDYASPVAADGKIYYVKSDGTTMVLNASDKFELLSANQITTDKENFGGTPAISGGQLFLRSDKNLYCIGK